MPISDGKRQRGVIDPLSLFAVLFLVASLLTAVVVTNYGGIQLLGSSAKERIKETGSSFQNYVDSQIRRAERASKGGCDGWRCVVTPYAATDAGSKNPSSSACVSYYTGQGVPSGDAQSQCGTEVVSEGQNAGAPEQPAGAQPAPQPAAQQPAAPVTQPTQPQITAKTNANCGIGFIAEGEVCRRVNPQPGQANVVDYKNIVFYNVAIGNVSTSTKSVKTGTNFTADVLNARDVCVQTIGDSKCSTVGDIVNFSLDQLKQQKQDPTLYTRAISTQEAKKATEQRQAAQPAVVTPPQVQQPQPAVSAPVANTNSNYSCPSGYSVEQNTYGVFYCKENTSISISQGKKVDGEFCSNPTECASGDCGATFLGLKTCHPPSAIPSQELATQLTYQKASTKPIGTSCSAKSECGSGNCSDSWVIPDGSRSISLKGKICTFSEAEQNAFLNASSVRQTEVVSNTAQGLALLSGGAEIANGIKGIFRLAAGDATKLIPSIAIILPEILSSPAVNVPLTYVFVQPYIELKKQCDQVGGPANTWAEPCVELADYSVNLAAGFQAANEAQVAMQARKVGTSLGDILYGNPIPTTLDNPGSLARAVSSADQTAVALIAPSTATNMALTPTDAVQTSSLSEKLKNTFTSLKSSINEAASVLRLPSADNPEAYGGLGTYGGQTIISRSNMPVNLTSQEQALWIARHQAAENWTYNTTYITSKYTNAGYQPLSASELYQPNSIVQALNEAPDPAGILTFLDQQSKLGLTPSEILTNTRQYVTGNGAIILETPPVQNQWWVNTPSGDGISWTYGLDLPYSDPAVTFGVYHGGFNGVGISAAGTKFAFPSTPITQLPFTPYQGDAILLNRLALEEIGPQKELQTVVHEFGHLAESSLLPNRSSYFWSFDDVTKRWSIEQATGAPVTEYISTLYGIKAGQTLAPNSVNLAVDTINGQVVLNANIVNPNPSYLVPLDDISQQLILNNPAAGRIVPELPAAPVEITAKSGSTIGRFGPSSSGQSVNLDSPIFDVGVSRNQLTTEVTSQGDVLLTYNEGSKTLINKVPMETGVKTPIKVGDVIEMSSQTSLKLTGFDTNGNPVFQMQTVSSKPTLIERLFTGRETAETLFQLPEKNVVFHPGDRVTTPDLPGYGLIPETTVEGKQVYMQVSWDKNLGQKTLPVVLQDTNILPTVTGRYTIDFGTLENGKFIADPGFPQIDVNSPIPSTLVSKEPGLFSDLISKYIKDDRGWLPWLRTPTAPTVQTAENLAAQQVRILDETGIPHPSGRSNPNKYLTDLKAVADQNGIRIRPISEFPEPVPGNVPIFVDDALGTGDIFVRNPNSTDPKDLEVLAKELDRAINNRYFSGGPADTFDYEARLASISPQEPDYLARIFPPADTSAAPEFASEFIGPLTEVETLRADNLALRDLASTDELTGLSNRRAYDALLKKAQAEGRKITIVNIDLRDFKQINDNFGHPYGDEVLIKFGDFLSENTRISDKVFRAVRVSGDEFALIFEGASESEARAIVERLTSKLATTTDEALSLVKVDYGIAALQDGETIAAAQKRADELMYAFKNAAKGAEAAGPIVPPAGPKTFSDLYGRVIRNESGTWLPFLSTGQKRALRLIFLTGSVVSQNASDTYDRAINSATETILNAFRSVRNLFVSNPSAPSSPASQPGGQEQSDANKKSPTAATPEKVYPNLPGSGEAIRLDLNSTPDQDKAVAFVDQIFNDYNKLHPLPTDRAATQAEKQAFADYIVERLKNSDFKYILGSQISKNGKVYDFNYFITDYIRKWYGYNQENIGKVQETQCAVWQIFMAAIYPQLDLANIEGYSIEQAEQVFGYADHEKLNRGKLPIRQMMNKNPNGEYMYYMAGDIVMWHFNSVDKVQRGDTFVYGNHMGVIVNKFTKDGKLYFEITEANSPKGNLDGTPLTYLVDEEKFKEIIGLQQTVFLRPSIRLDKIIPAENLPEAAASDFNTTGSTENVQAPTIGGNAENAELAGPAPKFAYFSQRDEKWAEGTGVNTKVWTANSCGIMTGAMVTKSDPNTYYKEFRDFFNGNRRVTKKGTAFDDHRDFLESMGYTFVPVQGKLKDIKSQITKYGSKGIPVWVNAYIETGDGTKKWIGHQTMAIGVDQDGNIIFNDPYYGENVAIPDSRIVEGEQNGLDSWKVFAVLPPENK